MSKNTPFIENHMAFGAKILPFAGFNMPIEYSGIKDEHMTVRNGVGVFDVSHMGEFKVEGPNALELIQRMTSNDASKLADGQIQYSGLMMPAGTFEGASLLSSSITRHSFPCFIK